MELQVAQARQMAGIALRALGVIPKNTPRSYHDGATTPLHVPVPEIPRANGGLGASLNAALDAGASEAIAKAAPTLAPTPAGFEPGLMEDSWGRSLTAEEVEDFLDEMVRPGLNADGGDIRLIKIENNDVFVKLVGACSTCPSSVMTMKMGVERLMQDEFPDMGELIDIGAGEF